MERPPSEEHPPLFDEQTSGEEPSPGPGADKSEALRRIRGHLRLQRERVDEAAGQETEPTDGEEPSGDDRGGD
ncbi:MAG: hypothetical protein ACRDI0_13640 [Actinomycetota bacterium]